MTELKEIPEKQSHSRSQEVTCQPLTPEQNEIQQQQPTQNPNTKESMRSRTKQEIHMQHALAALGIHHLIFCCLRTSCGLCNLSAFKQKVMLGVSPLVFLKEILVNLQKNLNVCFQKSQNTSVSRGWRTTLSISVFIQGRLFLNFQGLAGFHSH